MATTKTRPAPTAKARQRVADLDRLLADEGDGTTHGPNVIMRELVELHFAILTGKVDLTLADLKARVRRADEFLPNVTASLPR